jgi:hypothetical protein
MPSYDPARVLRDYGLEPLRRELSGSGLRSLVVTGAPGLAPLATSSEPYDGAWIEAEGLEAIELPALAAGVAHALRSGGRLICVVPGAWPLRQLLMRALLGRGEPPGALRARIDGNPGRLAFSAWRRAFEPAIIWRRSRALGVLVPPASAWAQLRPLTLGLLAMGEHVTGGWPVVRALGTWVVHEGVRR